MNIITTVMAVFTAIGGWFVETIPNILGLFWNNTDGLTIIGTLSVCALGFSIVLLLANWIIDFFKWRR